MNIAKDTIVAIDYVLTNDAGEEIDSSKGKEPLVYLHGAGHLVPGLEAELEGKSKGDEVAAVVPPATGYGERNEEMIQEVPKDRFPEGMALEPGMTLQAQSPAGVKVVTVVGVEEEHVRIDANHPLAGVTLHFDVTVREVREATPEELAHACGHGGGGGSCGDGSCGGSCDH